MLNILVSKAQKVIKGNETQEQFKAAQNYLDLLYMKIINEKLMKKDPAKTLILILEDELNHFYKEWIFRD